MIGFIRRMQDKHYRRAERRRNAEEIMAWICVPVLIVIAWSAYRAWEEVNVARAPSGPEQLIPSTTTIRRN